MSLTGNLRTMDLPEILQWISTGRKTGTLHIEHRSVHKRIVFKGGVIHSSTSTLFLELTIQLRQSISPGTTGLNFSVPKH